ncbi:MAG: hypothetical protein Q7U96_01890, partial [Chloroflexota bacterium]|nr:hypothetical protein [Chloroflexota bacterium]
FGQTDILTTQSLPTIDVPNTGTSAGRFSGSFSVPSLPPGNYQVKFRVGTAPNDKLISQSFTITGPNDTFVLQASPQSVWTEQGADARTVIFAHSVGSTAPSVKLAVEGAPQDITPSFQSSTLTPAPGGAVNTELTLATSDWISTGHYSVLVRGWLDANANGSADQGEEVHRVNLEIDVVPPAGSGFASIYINPTVGPPGTWLNITGSGFPASSAVEHLYLGTPVTQNDFINQLPAMTTTAQGALTLVLQIPVALGQGNYPVEVVVGGTHASAPFTVVSSGATFSINLSPSFLHTAPDTVVGASAGIQSMGSSSPNVNLNIQGPPAIKWRINGGAWNTPAV